MCKHTCTERKDGLKICRDECKQVIGFYRQSPEPVETWKYDSLGFHVSGGWHFKRLPSGTVMIAKLDDIEGFGIITTHAFIDASSWASVISSVSIKGDNLEQYSQALKLHMG